MYNSFKYGYKNPEHRKAYVCWQAMMLRCYNKNHKAYRFYGKRGVHVCYEWHDFQEFAKFYYEDKYRQPGWHLDKDLLVDNNLIYSPDTCCFVPQVLNNVLVGYDHTIKTAEKNALKQAQIRELGRKYQDKLDYRLVAKLVNFTFVQHP